MLNNDRLFIHQERNKVLFDPVSSENAKNLHGEKGFVKKGKWFERTITVKGEDGLNYKLNKSSFINFLNAQYKNDPNFKKLDKRWLVGSSDKKVLEAFKKFTGPSDAQKNLKTLTALRSSSNLLGQKTQSDLEKLGGVCLASRKNASGFFEGTAIFKEKSKWVLYICSSQGNQLDNEEKFSELMEITAQQLANKRIIPEAYVIDGKETNATNRTFLKWQKT
jgi:hypothetical protein